MPGNPIARSRARTHDIKNITPRIPAEQWKRMSDTERIGAIFSDNLDNIYALISIPFAEADLHERALQVRVFEIFMRAGLKFADMSARREEAHALLEGLDRALSERAWQADAGGVEGR